MNHSSAEQPGGEAERADRERWGWWGWVLNKTVLNNTWRGFFFLLAFTSEEQCGGQKQKQTKRNGKENKVA